MTDLSVIIVNYNTKDLTLKCIKSVLAQKTDLKVDLVVVDNGSTDGAASQIKRQFPKVKLVVSETNLGFTGGNNLGIKRVVAKFYMLLNSDAFITDGSLDEFVRYAQDSNLGVVGCKVLNPDGSFQASGGRLPTLSQVLLWLSGIDDLLKTASYQMRRIKDFETGKIGWISGTVMLISDETIKKVGLLDTKLFMYGEDVEYCFRAWKRGIRVGWSDKLTVTHLGGASTNNPKFTQWRGEFKGLLYIYQKYYGKLATYLLRLMIYLFVTLRVIAFALIGKFSYSKTYGKIIFSI